MLSDPNFLAYLETLHRNYVIALIDKPSDDFALICKWFYIFKVLSQVG